MSRAATGRGVIGLLLLLTAAGCAAMSAGPAVLFSPPTGSATVPGVRFFSDDDRMCGPSSLASVLAFHGIDVSPEEAARAVWREEIRGSIGLDLTLYAREKGLEANWSTGRPADLHDEIAAGRPLLVRFDFGSSLVPVSHFTVVTGYSPEGALLYNGEVMDWARFGRVWGRTDYWNLKVRRPDSEERS